MAGRPKRQFTEEQIDWVKENAAFVTITEVATHLSIPHETARNHFGEIVKKAQLGKKLELRRAMWEKAIEEGNPTIMIWLSKNFLNMSDDGILDSDELVGEIEFGDV